MKLIQASLHRFSFHIGKNEQQLLFKVLELYPLIPATHHKLSKSEDRPEDQRALEEALTEQRAAHKKKLAALLKSPGTFSEHHQGFQFSLSTTQIEWLLQVLNDVRVGSWLLLGSPEKATPALALLKEQNPRYLWSMELAAVFQMTLLAAIGGGAPGSPPTTSSKA